MKMILGVLGAAILFSAAGCVAPVHRERVYVREPYRHNYHRHYYWQHKGYEPYHYHHHHRYYR